MGTVHLQHFHATHPTKTTMKSFSACILFMAASGAEAFVAPAGRVTQSRVSDVNMVFGKKAPAPTPVVVESVWADPIAGHSSTLSMDDISWDPLGLASEDKLAEYREAELKHGRLAMLAALGWPASEALEPVIAKFTGAKDELIETAGRAPALLNGGLEENQIPYFLGTVLLGAAFADIYGQKIQVEQGLEPGNVGFDPLGLFPDDIETQEKYRIAELKHGRIAMVAVALYALEEAISGTSILKETVPLVNEVGRLGMEGPIQGNLDLVKDLATDAKALITDVEKEVDFYESAVSPTAKPLF